MTKHIILCFDGTWNTPDANPIDGDRSTNVFKLYEAIAEKNDNEIIQLKWYESGVGTEWYNKIRGGAFGVGLSEKIQSGYAHLAEVYEDGDRIFIYGFSRGAYCARSLVGMIRNAGLLRREHVDRTRDAYRLYRTRDRGPDEENARIFRRQYARDVQIQLLGVWDTVGALGIPVESFDRFNKAYYEFHDTELSSIVKNAFHAVAIDEHRKCYQPTLWNPANKMEQRVEQVWFCGAHADVGGGYPEAVFSNIALHWMMERSRECGLAFKPINISEFVPNVLPCADSYKEFLAGAYSCFTPRYLRKIGATVYGCESIHESVCRKLAADRHYRPQNEVDMFLTGTFIPVGRLAPGENEEKCDLLQQA
jgi:uncharacterized protein (DUF2235 family)